MKKRAYIKPTKPSLIYGMVAIGFMLLFVLFFMFLLIGEPDSHIGIGFLSIFILFLLFIGGSFLYNYKNYDKNPENSLAGGIELNDAFETAQPESNFEEKLRKLESLKKNNLISDTEYHSKRKEIMDQKW